MSQRTEKVESLVQQSVARGLLSYLSGDMARVTVTRVDVSPDLRHALVWIGIVADEAATTLLLKRIEGLRPALQHDLAGQIATRSVPRLAFRLDTGGQYAAEMERLLKHL